MTDRDIVDRAAALWRRAVCAYDRRPRPHLKTVYVSTVRGSPAVAWMRRVYPIMGARRQQQIERAAGGHTRQVRSTPHGACDVDDCGRGGAVRGLCRRHYKLWWKAQRYGRRAKYAPRCAPSVTEVAGEVLRSTLPDESATVAWLAGLLEGEGTFASNRSYPVISIEMTDLDVVQRAAAILEVNARPRDIERNAAMGWSPTFVATLSGQSACHWMRRLQAWMGTRRSAEIVRALEAYHPIRLITPPPTCVATGCAGDHRSRGLCHRHYMQWDRDRRAGREPRVRPLR